MAAALAAKLDEEEAGAQRERRSVMASTNRLLYLLEDLGLKSAKYGSASNMRFYIKLDQFVGRWTKKCAAPLSKHGGCAHE